MGCAVGFQAWGPPIGPVARVCQPASSDKPVGFGSSAAALHAYRMFPLSEPNNTEIGCTIIMSNIKIVNTVVMTT